MREQSCSASRLEETGAVEARRGIHLRTLPQRLPSQDVYVDFHLFVAWNRRIHEGASGSSIPNPSCRYQSCVHGGLTPCVSLRRHWRAAAKLKAPLAHT